MKGSILYVAYPLLPVTDESCGGAEQMLALTERSMCERGWDTCLAAAAGSRPAGRLFETGNAASGPDRFEERQREQDVRVLSLLQSPFASFDLVHDKSGSFWQHADQFDVPVLATLHLPRSFYPNGLFESIAPNVFFNCVSESQAESFGDLPNLLGVIQNGIATDRFPLSLRK